MGAVLRRRLLVGSVALAVLGTLAVLIAPGVGPTLPRRGSAAGLVEPSTRPVPLAAPRHAQFGSAAPSADARHIADWVADAGDNAGSAFVIVDKKFATLYVFDADARLRATTPILLGAAAGDDSVPGIGKRPIAKVLPHERTTPAGRFMAERGHNTRGHDVVWLDYDATVSMHRVLTTHADEHRLQRLATPTIDDNRISYGCINVPVAFYETYVRPVFATRRAPVYVLPEVKPVQQVFGSYDVAAGYGPEAGRSATASCVGAVCAGAPDPKAATTTSMPAPAARSGLHS